MPEQDGHAEYHLRRAEQERCRAATATEPYIRQVHERLAELHLEHASRPTKLMVVRDA